jgi:hypothetical protein
MAPWEPDINDIIEALEAPGPLNRGRLGPWLRGETHRGHPLACSECGVITEGSARGWTLRLDIDDDLHAFCPDCDEREFGGGS